MITSYCTITHNAEVVYKEKASKFYAFAYPVPDEEAVKIHLALLKKKYFDASHHCYAYVLGNEAQATRAHDAGEPSHSAGDLILGQIKSKKLTYTLVVVVRYFGGTKLGVGGLVQAYKASAALVLEQCTIIEKPITTTLKLFFAYEQLNNVLRVLKEQSVQVLEQTYDNTNCVLLCGVGVAKEIQLRSKLSLLVSTIS